MYLTCQSIPLSSIQLCTDWNLHPWEFGIITPELEESLTLNGIIHPPLVLADSAKTFTVISGAKRLEFTRRLSWPSHLCCMVLAENTPPRLILNLILADQNTASKLSLAEKARFVEIACRLLNIEDVKSICKKELQLKTGRSTISDLLRILQQDEIIIKEIHAGRLQDRMVSEILSLAEESDKLALVQLFKSFGMGDGKQKRFFTLIRDIALREGLTISSYLQQEKIRAILDHEEMNVPQKIHHLGELLQQEISPSYSVAERDFVKQVKDLHLPINYSISHSPSFEKDEITLSIIFKNIAACKNYLAPKDKR
ncbi:MAG: hypothetical protein WBB23_03960 [Desulforhopalus sp.]